MNRRRSFWMEDDGDLQVFVPGLMATGILVSIGMLVWDGIKRFVPDVGRRQRAARLAERSSGRVSDLISIREGEVPSITRVPRARRSRVTCFVRAGLSWVIASGIATATLEAYAGPEGPLVERGWTLSVGLGVAGSFVLAGFVWLLSGALRTTRPAWLERVEHTWPFGDLPDPDAGTIDA